MTEMESLLDQRLATLVAERSCVEIFRSPKSTVVGRLIAASNFVFVMEKVIDLQVDGLFAARTQDITRLRTASRDLELMSQLFHGRPAPEIPRVALLELSSAITIFNQMYGAVTVYSENTEPDACIVGEEVALDDAWVQLREFGTRGRRERADVFVSIDQITRVEAGGKYERTLRDIYYPKEATVS
jgi:hypothetical protein